MPEETSASGEPFDLEKLKELIEMMEQHGLTEISLRAGDEQWRLRRGPQEVIQPSAPAAPPPAAPPPQPTAPAGESSEEASSAGTLEITSPTVGTFYAAPSPDDPPFVSVGSHVESDTIVCVVEAMKVFNQIPAEVTGKITDVLVNNGDPVEYGQPLFRVQPG